jgi:hypothetical protein
MSITLLGIVWFLPSVLVFFTSHLKIIAAITKKCIERKKNGERRYRVRWNGLRFTTREREMERKRAREREIQRKRNKFKESESTLRKESERAKYNEREI